MSTSHPLFSGRPLRRLFRGVLGAVFCTFVLSLHAADGARKNFDLPTADASASLKLFSQQSGEQIVYPVEQVRGVRTVAVKGEFTPRGALDRMLAGTGLVVVQDETTGALAVRPALPEESKNVPSRLADRPAAETDGRIVKLETFEVFDSKLINADLPRSRDDVQPYVVIARDQIEQSNAATLDEFFRTRLPMNNVGAGTPSNFLSAATSSAINLRGLGTNQTLILLDGRRIPSRNVAGAGTGSAQGDINGIPLSMIERIEILPSTASGIYGGGATGGVINIVTRKDYSGVEATFSYANTFDTDASLRRVDLNGSFSLPGGKTFLTLSSSYADGTSLIGQDRDFAQRARALQLANNAAAFYGASVTPPVGYTTNIRNSTAANLVLKPQYGGAALASPYTHVPVGYAGVSADNGAALVAAAGTYNLDLPATQSAGGLTAMMAVPKIKSWALGARHQFGSRVEAYVDVSALNNTGYAPTASISPSSFTLAATAPTNPFTTAVVVAYPGTNVSYLSKQENESDRIAAGVIVQLPRAWTAGVDYVWTKARSLQDSPTSMVGDPDGAAGPQVAYATALATGAVDVLRDLNVSPIDYTPYLMPKNTQHTDYGTLGREGSLRAAGPVWELPAGPINVAFSIDWHREEQPSTIYEGAFSVPSTFVWFPSVAIDQGSAHLEARVPVFAEKSAPLLRALELQGSYRYDLVRSKGPSKSGGVTVAGADGPVPTSPYDYLIEHLRASSGMAGFKYSPLPDIALRASWGTGFLPPSLGQLGSFSSFTSGGLNVVDPKRSGVLANTGPIIINQGGNTGLRPEFSSNLSGGVIITPRFAPGLRISVDWTQIHKRDEITSLSFQQDLDYEDLIPGRVTRDPLTAADRALGYTGGKITALSTQYVNVARKKLTAWDFQVDYERQLGSPGSFHLYAIATCQPQFTSQVVPDGPFTNAVGYTGPLRWRGNAGLDWRRGRWSAGWNLQYYDSYLGYSSAASTANIATFVLNQGSATIPSQRYHDVYIGYEFGRAAEGRRRYLDGMRVTAGVQNVFNTSPPILAGTSATQGFSSYGDPRLARYTLTLRKKF